VVASFQDILYEVSINVKKVFTLAVSINAWVYGSIIGINFVKLDPMAGAEKSAQVRSILLE
jgi:hypothetical protein